MSDQHRPIGDIQRQMAEGRAAREEVLFEHRRVDHVLGLFKLSRQRQELRGLALERTGEPYLRFADFHEVVPDFPVYLGASRLEGKALHAHPDATLPALFLRFDRSPLAAAYERFYEQAQAVVGVRPVGLIVPRAGVPHGLLVHNGGLDDYFVRGAVFVYTGGTEAARRRLYVQPLAPLLQAVCRSGYGWRPRA